jgi:hypothetical protein
MDALEPGGEMPPHDPPAVGALSVTADDPQAPIDGALHGPDVLLQINRLLHLGLRILGPRP